MSATSPPGTVESSEQAPTPITAAPSAKIAPIDYSTLPSLRVAKRIVTVNLDDVDEVYKGMNFRAWTNYPPEIRERLQRNDEASRFSALREIVVETNFEDTDGNPFPSPSEETFWRALPDDLAVVIIQKIVQQVGKLTPTSGGR